LRLRINTDFALLARHLKHRERVSKFAAIPELERAYISYLECFAWGTYQQYLHAEGNYFRLLDEARNAA
jgi:hypothetical protein